MNILAIDMGTKTGWAHGDGPSGVWDLRIKRDESGGMRLIRFRAKLDELGSGAAVDLVAFEATRHAAPGMAGSVTFQAELQGVLKLWCERRGIEYKGYSPMEIKAHAIPRKGARRDKEAMTEAAEKRWPEVEIVDDNHADALWLLDLATREYGEVDADPAPP